MADNWKLQLDSEAFLATHWQSQPLLIKDAISNFKPPINSDSLAGLALEEGIESRLIEHRNTQWQLHHGPFSESDFSRDCPWTLLVQAVDHTIPQVAQLRKLFDFIPQWRVDDVMVSYAVDGGSVGPHFDNYDVFLLQGEGERLWRLGQHCDDSTPLLDHKELRILQDFSVEKEYILGPGDMLYVPPGVAHWGVARGDCTTFSIGFRAPRINEMVSRWADQLLEQLPGQQFYRDPRSSVAKRPGEIRTEDIERARTQLESALRTDHNNHWFGELLTEPRYDPHQEDNAQATAQTPIGDDTRMVELLPSAKLAWQQAPQGIALFANGASLAVDASALPSVLLLCGEWRLEGADLQRARHDPNAAQVLAWLLDNGCLYVE